MTTPLPPHKSLRVLSCVPKQQYSFKAKLAWVRQMAEEHRPDVFVLPQEYHGGVQKLFFKTEDKLAYEEAEILEPYTKLAAEFDMGITVGALVDDRGLKERRERIYVIDPQAGMTGFADKVTLPAYDHVDAKGKTRVYPETDLNNRAMAFPCKGARISILFCWEVYSSFIWHAIARAQPDFVVSMVKFGVKGWPVKEKDAEGQSIVAGFGFGSDGGWLERLRMAAKWDLAAPIVCSTNSWDLPNKCGAISGVILPWEEKESVGEWPRPARKHSLWVSEGKGSLNTDHVQVDAVDFLYWRLVRDHKFTMFDQTGEWPSSEARELTMNWKVKRMERQMVGLPKLMARGAGSKPVVKTPKGMSEREPGLFDE